MSEILNSKGLKFIRCDFCEATIRRYENPQKNIEWSKGWSWARRSKIEPVDFQGCSLIDEIKHSCPDDNCQNQLAVWSRNP